MSKTNKLITADQQQLVNEFVEAHGLEARQISFEGESLEPIFDYDALNYLRHKLTDLQATEPSIVERNVELQMVTAKCLVTLADGRTASDLGTAAIGEQMPDGGEIGDFIQAQNVALSRALRRGLRSAGINLLAVHKNYLKTGEVASGIVDTEFETKIGKEIHALAYQFGHLERGDKTKYQDFIENMFGGGKRSSLQLNDIQKSQLAKIYRLLLNARNLSEIQEQKIAA